MPDVPSALRVKRRRLPYGNVEYQQSSYSTDAYGVERINPWTGSKWSVSGKQMTASEGHPWTRSSGYEGDDVGGPFETSKWYLARDKWGEKPIDMSTIPKYYLDTALTGSQTTGYLYRGHLNPTPCLNDTEWPEPAPSTDSELMAWGTKAISIVKPTNSIADLSVSLAELYREGIPNAPGMGLLWKDRAYKARDAGSDYLGIQFGWLPLISEVQNVSKAISNADEIWDQYARDSGRLVRRRFEFPPVFSNPVQVSSSTGKYPFPGASTYFYPPGFSGGRLTRTRYKRQRRWFSGAFTYYLPNPEDSSAVGRMKTAAAKARKLYGLTLDPEVLWNLTPWSWAADWFANTGDVISNLSDFATDGLVLRYGYMMEETIVSDEYTLSDLRWASSPPGPASTTLYLVVKTKKRVAATPYGFGLTWDNFTPRQLSIMAALGISRKR